MIKTLSFIHLSSYLFIYLYIYLFIYLLIHFMILSLIFKPRKFLNSSFVFKSICFYRHFTGYMATLFNAVGLEVMEIHSRKSQVRTIFWKVTLLNSTQALLYSIFYLLYCTLLYFTILCCTLLYCTRLYRTRLSSPVHY